jgi:hypothetical protein
MYIYKKKTFDNSIFVYLKCIEYNQQLLNFQCVIKRTQGTNNDLQNTTQNTKDIATQTPIKNRSELRWSGTKSFMIRLVFLEID